MSKNPGDTFTALQKRFADAYLKDFKITKAAIRAGYDAKSAGKVGWQTLRKQHVKDYIAKRLKEMEVSPEETTKLITNIAKGNLADYFVARKVEYTPRIRVPIATVITSLENDIAFEVEFSEYAGLKGRERRSHAALIEDLQNRLLRLKLEQEKNPKAHKITNGETVLVDQHVLDMGLLLADKERGIIKSVVPTEYGLKVEMYAADSALISLAKINGLFAKDNEQKNPGNEIPDDKFNELLNTVRDTQKKINKR